MTTATKTSADTTTITVREVALTTPDATRVLEKLGIDYCCGGHRPLAEAAADANLSVNEVLRAIEDAKNDTVARTATTDWTKESLTALVEHINGTHHMFVKTESPRIQALAEKVAGKHGPNHPELKEVKETFEALGDELAQHLMKEEQILFPYIAGMERAQRTGEPLPHSCFGTVQNPIRMMFLEHDDAGEALKQLRQLTNNYTTPADGCVSYKTLYEALAGFEADLHQHIHKENNIMFPRAIEIETSNSIG
jgi:regulator of cell morphogenesis and NO signaling